MLDDSGRSFPSLGVEEAAGGVELAEIHGQNVDVFLSLCLVGGRNVTDRYRLS
jgi:hypothetical protein